MSEIDYDVERLLAEWLEREQHVVDEEVAIELTNFVAIGHVVEDREAEFAKARLVEDVHRLDALELVALMRVVFAHHLLEVRAHELDAAREPVHVGERAVLRPGRAEMREQSDHFVERPPTCRLLIARTAQVVADLLLVDPEQTVQREHTGLAHERGACCARAHARCRPAARTAARAAAEAKTRGARGCSATEQWATTTHRSTAATQWANRYIRSRGDRVAPASEFVLQPDSTRLKRGLH